MGSLGTRGGVLGRVQLQWAEGFYSLSTGIIPDPMSSSGWRVRTWGPRSVSNTADVFPCLRGSEVHADWLAGGRKP